LDFRWLGGCRNLPVGDETLGADNRNKNARSSELAASAIANARASQTPRELSPLAKIIAAEPSPPAMSAVVLGGSIRIAEFLILSVIGAAIYVY